MVLIGLAAQVMLWRVFMVSAMPAIFLGLGATFALFVGVISMTESDAHSAFVRMLESSNWLFNPTSREAFRPDLLIWNPVVQVAMPLLLLWWVWVRTNLAYESPGHRRALGAALFPVVLAVQHMLLFLPPAQVWSVLCGLVGR